MIRRFCSALAIALFASSASTHEIHYGESAVLSPYAPYSFLIGDWDVATAANARPFVRLKYHWAPNRAYIECGAYIGDAPHFEGMMMWNGVRHQLDVLLATDMKHGLAQESGTAAIEGGAFVQNTLATYSAGVGADEHVAGVNGSTQRMREIMRPVDANHIALSFEVETSTGWKPVMPGADHLVMTRASD